MESFKRTIVIGNEANLVKPTPKHEDEPTHRYIASLLVGLESEMMN
jgi:hypothetical protein